MRTSINGIVNVCTDEHSNARPDCDGRIAPEITIPSLRARLTITEAEALADALRLAVLAARANQS
jgi:hypothetical protein